MSFFRATHFLVSIQIAKAVQSTPSTQTIAQTPDTAISKIEPNPEPLGKHGMSVRENWCEGICLFLSYGILHPLIDRKMLVTNIRSIAIFFIIL